MSRKSIVRTRLSADNLPKPTKKQLAMFERLDKMTDADIDFSDIPELDVLKCPPKKMTTVRIDLDILDWLRSFGKGYQSRINAILRHEMLAYKAKY